MHRKARVVTRAAAASARQSPTPAIRSIAGRPDGWETVGRAHGPFSAPLVEQLCASGRSARVRHCSYLLPAVLATSCSTRADPPAPITAEPAASRGRDVAAVAPAASRSSRFVRLSAGGGHTCALGADGSITCWGDGAFGQLQAPAGTFVDLASGGLHSCARRTDRTLECWGHMSNEPATARAGTFDELTTGNITSCARRGDHHVECWWTLNRTLQAARAPTEPLSGISAGAAHACGLRSGGAIGCWSTDGFGWRATSAALAAPQGLFKLVDAGGNSAIGSRACAIRTDDTVACWGDDPDAMPPPAGRFTSIAVGPGSHACGVRVGGSLSCWGSDESGQATPPTGSFAAVTTGGRHSCGLRSDGGVVCWGDNARGQLEVPR